MDAAELKAMQAPLKAAYRKDASKAVITLHFGSLFVSGLLA